MDQDSVTLVELRAGRLKFDGKVLQPDSRKGLLRVVRTEDTLTHILWFERATATTLKTGEPEEDIVVFPEECCLETIPGQARTYILKFPADADRNLFWWMQEPKPDGDAALVARFNAAVNGQELPELPAAFAPAAPAAPAPAAPAAPAPAAAAPAAAQQPAGNSQAAMLASLLSSAFASSAPGASDQASSAEQLAHSLLAQLAAAQGQGQGQGRRRMVMDEGPGLHEVLRPEVVVPLLRQPGTLERLEQYLPEEHRSVEQLIATAHSPQFQQMLSSFSSALQSGQLDVAAFGLKSKGFSVADFLGAIQDQVDEERKGAQGAGAPETDAAGGAAPMEQ